MKIVIVGGVAGGATAAARIRRLDENAEIIIFERSGYISYANCGLPYYIGGEIADKEDLFLQTPEGFWSRFKIDVRTLHEVTKINRERKTVTVLDKIICVPKGNPNKTLSGFWEDSTRLPEFYDGTYEYLKSLGIEEI